MYLNNAGKGPPEISDSTPRTQPVVISKKKKTRFLDNVSPSSGLPEILVLIKVAPSHHNHRLRIRSSRQMFVPVDSLLLVVVVVTIHFPRKGDTPSLSASVMEKLREKKVNNK
jgi:hypothetical protein